MPASEGSKRAKPMKETPVDNRGSSQRPKPSNSQPAKRDPATDVNDTSSGGQDSSSMAGSANANYNNPNSCISEGDLSLKRGDFRRAAEAYSMALQFRPEDKLALCSRSKAYLLMGLSKPALEDAEQVLVLCGLSEGYFEALASSRAPTTSSEPSPNNASSSPLGTKAIHLKAEALYSMGLFEEALMWFHRGKQRCLAKSGTGPTSAPGSDQQGAAGPAPAATDNAQMTEFRMGITKAEEAIRNALSLGHRDGQPSRSHHANKEPNKGAKPSQGAPTTPATQPNGNDPSILGPLAQDLIYLRGMCADPLLDGMQKVKSLALEGMEYLENRATFWRSQRGLDRAVVGAATPGPAQSTKVTFGEPLPRVAHQSGSRKQLHAHGNAAVPESKQFAGQTAENSRADARGRKP